MEEAIPRNVPLWLVHQGIAETMKCNSGTGDNQHSSEALMNIQLLRPGNPHHRCRSHMAGPSVVVDEFVARISGSDDAYTPSPSTSRYLFAKGHRQQPL